MIYCGLGLLARYNDHNVKEEQLFVSIDRNSSLKILQPRYEPYSLTDSLTVHVYINHFH